MNHIVFSQGMHGLKTRNTVKNMVACCRPTQLKLVREQRKEAYHRYTVTLTAAVSFSSSQQSSRELNLGRFVQKVDNAIHWINLCPVVNNTLNFLNTYLLECIVIYLEGKTYRY